MDIKVRLFAIGASGNSERTLTLDDGASVADALNNLNIGDAEAYLTLLGEASVPMAERGECNIKDGDVLTVFPPIKGG